MELLIELLKISLPAAIVLYGMYLSVKSFLSKDFNSKLLELKAKNTDVVLPVRLQAFERMALYLERITPNNLLLRLNDISYSSGQLHEILLSEIRQEYNYNLSQQIYMSDKTWSMIREATEQVTATINDAAMEVEKDTPSLNLARKIMERLIESGQDLTAQALIVLKEEVRTYF